ncbi:unnamed protein product [Peronospora destructor]|uniref:HTH CENPB-type domain-containing protein n=1 Tax=Peronospora destructor TaxID=86335 RepID=A0AAV0TT89_9STRA|nr:unnamed protein product [Peronospora destructor]
MAIARHHLTIQEKNQVRAYHRERPDLTQEQLREWVHGKFNKWIGRSTIGKIASIPEEVCANPSAKRIQSGRYPEMEAELYEHIIAKQSEKHGDEPLRDELPILSEGLLWTKANEILIRTRGPSQSVSLGWVQRFKKRHGLHRSQRLGSESKNPVKEQIRETMGLGSNCVGLKRGRDEDKQLATIPSAGTTCTDTGRTPSRKQFVSADDILLLTQVSITKPWAYSHMMDGWQEVCEQLRKHSDFNLEKTAGACQARIALLLDHLRAGNVAALRKAGTSKEYERKRELLVEHDAAVAKVGEAAAAIAVAEATGEANRDSQRRLELLEIRMECEFAKQRRHVDEQVHRLERLQQAQLETQQKQHAQLLATIQQQQAMMLELIKSVVAQSNKD